jgi:hypothetical protein
LGPFWAYNNLTQAANTMYTVEVLNFKDAKHLFNMETQIVPIAGDYIKYDYILYKVIERGFEVYPATAIRLYVEIK